MKIPDHPPKFSPEGFSHHHGIETTLTYDEMLEWLRKNDLPETEESAAEFTTAWYLKFRETGYRDAYMEEQILNANDVN